MRIESITDDKIKFDNGSEITFDHSQNCCEYNYADFLYLVDESGLFDYEFDKNLDFEEVLSGDCGFRFGNKNGRMFFVPCYSEQNGYYSFDLDIYYNDKLELTVECDIASN